MDDSDEEEIPTIFASTTNMNSFNASNNNDDANQNDNAEDDVLMGDVEVKAKKTNWIGNFDDDDEGFNFI